MANIQVLDTGSPNYKTKGEKVSREPSIGSTPRKKLADITNYQQWAKQSNQGTKQLDLKLISSEEYIEKLKKENMTLMKVLAERNKFIELGRTELHKLRTNFQKLQQQNFQLAQANNELLAELNLKKDRLKGLQHELGCMNGLLKAKEIQLQKHRAPENEIGAIKHEGVGRPSQEDNVDSKTCNAKRWRQSAIKSASNFDAKSVQVNANAIKKRVSGRRKSCKPDEPEQISLTSAVKNTDEIVDNKRLCVRRQSARFKSREPESTETLHEIHNAEERAETLSIPVHRQSARFKSQEDEPTESLHEMNDSKRTAETQRIRVRRKSMRFRSQEPPAAEDFETDDTKTQVTPSNEHMVQGGSVASSGSQMDVKEERKSVFETESHGSRTSVGRPSRRAAEKVQSYREVSLKVKMRRPE